MFDIAGQDHASETEGVMFTAANPVDRHHMVLVVAGNSALETVLLTKAGWNETQYTIFDSSREMTSGFLP
jgi:hypothetical protein